ncbi:MAG TPA: 3-keto-5-aminohexanoate cleavage protein [Acidimicrobiales bacterium]|nr:3-keto-5-aminohexanoate cleavage protein [Acidimicrobiales bacterium]
MAPVGAEASKSEVAALPTTLAELIQAARECEKAGASLIHVHLRDEATQPTLDVTYAKEVVTTLRQETALIVQLSTGGAVRDPESARIAVLEAQPDSASLTCGTVNFGTEVFVNRWPFIAELYRRMQATGIAPEFEIFDLGHISTLRRLLEEFGPPPDGHVHVDLVAGVRGGMPGTPEAILACVRDLDDGWTFSATGIGFSTIPVMLTSLALGGHLRVGMEDTLKFTRGRPVQSNAELVQRAATLATLAARPPMTPKETRALLHLPQYSSR